MKMALDYSVAAPPVQRRAAAPPVQAGVAAPPVQLAGPQVLADTNRVETNTATPAGRQTPAWLASLVVHLAGVLGLALVGVDLSRPMQSVELVAPVNEPEQEPLLPEQFAIDDDIQNQIGAMSTGGAEMAVSMAPEVVEVAEVPSPSELLPTDVAQIRIENKLLDVTRGMQYENLPVMGHVGEATTGAEGAIQRLTHEILLSLEERNTLVVWLFDQSPSLIPRRKEIVGRFERIYEELGIIEASGNPVFRRNDGRPLLTSIVAFGQEVTLLTKDPTDDIAELRKVVQTLERDESGVERVFSAIYAAAERYKWLREVNAETGEPERNVMLIVVTDEAGDDVDGLEPTIRLCRRYEMPVYVIGVPAPFGRKEAIIKWVDPNPKFDQTPRRGRVDQGPESLLPERLRLRFSDEGREEELIDSGFGPYALTRLCYETGGIFFSVHPDRNVNRTVTWRETAPYAAHFTHFFDPEVMRRYRPDYVSREVYMRRLMANGARKALVKAAQMSWLTPMDKPRTRFVKRDEATFANALTEAQKQAAILAPKINALYFTLLQGEEDRPKETSPRWQAGYDLAMGRVMAVKVRTEAYNAMLAKAKRGLKFSDPKNNVWQLQPAAEISTGSAMAKMGQRAKEYLQRVIRMHPNTPWALLAQRELKSPLGWKWVEQREAPPQARNRKPGNNNRPMPRDDRRRSLQRKPSRPVPKRL